MGHLTAPGGRDAGDAIRRDVGQLFSRVSPGLQRAALVLEAQWKTVLLTPGRGRVYGRHQASAPGEPPAPDSGTLQRSVTHEALSEAVVRVGTNVEYAPLLEFGTLPRGRKANPRSGRGRLGSRLGGIAPRPHARPAERMAEPAMTAVLADELANGNVRADLGSDVGGLNV